MSKQKWIDLVSVYCIIYTVITLLNSVLYLYNDIYEDPSGNWHELDRAIILLIGVAAGLRLCLVYQFAGTIGKNGVSGYLD